MAQFPRCVVTSFRLHGMETTVLPGQGHCWPHSTTNHATCMEAIWRDSQLQPFPSFSVWISFSILYFSCLFRCFCLSSHFWCPRAQSSAPTSPLLTSPPSHPSWLSACLTQTHPPQKPFLVGAPPKPETTGNKEERWQKSSLGIALRWLR